MFTILYNILLPIIGVVALSALFNCWTPINTRMLSRLVIYLFAPFLVLGELVNTDMTHQEMGSVSLIVVLSTLLLFSAGWLAAILLKLERKTEGAFILSVGIGNVAGMGVPISGFAFGEAGVQPAVLFFAVASAMTNTFGVYITSRGSSSIGQSLKNIFKVPLLYATLLGIGLNLFDQSLPLPFERLTNLLADAAVPSLLVVLGAQLSSMRIKGKLLPVLTAASIKLILAPAIGFALISVLGLQGVTGQASILLISVPTALFATAFSTEFGSDGEFATAIIVVSSILSILTLSILLLLI